MKITSIRTLLFIISFIGLTGCVSTQAPPQVIAPVQMNSVIYTDKSLNEVKTLRIFESTFDTSFFVHNLKVSVQKQGIKASPTGTAEAWVMLKNHTEQNINIQGRVQYFDQSQAPSEAVSAWQRVFIPANGSGVYKELAINQDSTYYQIEFREGR